MATIIENGNNQKPKVMTVLQNQEVWRWMNFGPARRSVRGRSDQHGDAGRHPAKCAKAGVGHSVVRPAWSACCSATKMTRSSRGSTRGRISPTRQRFGVSETTSAFERWPPGGYVGRYEDRRPESFSSPSSRQTCREQLSGSRYHQAQRLTLRVPLFKDGVVTAKHFDEKEITAAAANPTAAGSLSAAVVREPVRHVLFIQNGGKEAQMIVYQDGVVINSDQPSRPAATSPPPPRRRSRMARTNRSGEEREHAQE